jgi:prolactin regulatory element-binding protein
MKIWPWPCTSSANAVPGINSSEEDRRTGNNEHLRSYEVKLPKTLSNAKDQKTPQGSIDFLSTSSLFTPPTSDGARRDAYQRIIRLSASPRSNAKTPNKRIGAVVSSLAGDENEIVVFNATSSRPDNPKDVINRIALHKQEAEDLDIYTGDGKFLLAYCTGHDVYFQSVQYDFERRKVIETPHTKKVYTVPFPDVAEKKGRSKIRCLRWLSPSHILLLANKPNKTGVELWVLKLYDEGPGPILLRKKLGRHAKAAVDMDVALLDEDAKGRYQAVVAVAALDVSLEVLTINYQGTASDSVGGFSSFATYWNVSSR